MRKLAFVFLSSIILSGCNFSKSLKVDLLSGLSTSGDQISCEDVFLSAGGQKVNRNTFTYGEKFVLNFSDMKGLKSENGSVFPDMGMFVLDKTGDTVMQARDLYSQYPNGVKGSPVLLSATLTAANPVHSGKDYTLFVKVNDKKDKGTFSAKLDFKVLLNPKLIVESNNGSYSEIFLYSKERGEVITDNKVKVNEKVFLVLEGLAGFTEVTGKVYPGISIKATGNDGEVILNADDLFADYSESGVSSSDYKAQVYANLTFNTSNLKNPVHCIVTVWDKKSDASIKVSTDLEVVQ